CRIFPLRHYPLQNCRQRKRPCLYHQLKQCSAPCFGLISPEDYNTLVEGATHFLSGRNREIVAIYKARMAAAAESMAYEEAGRYRDLIRAIDATVENQKVAAVGGDSDVIGMIAAGSDLQFSILFIRNGLLLGSSHYHFDWELDETEALASFVNAYYGQEVIIPDEIILPLPLEGQAALGELLTEKRGKKVAITSPLRGAKLGLVRMAVKNAENAALQRLKKLEESGALLAELQEKLQLQRSPQRIECYAISNIQGENAVGSQVSFFDGKPDKSRYRKYRIKTVGQADDFAMMREVLSRRFKEGKTVDAPDLIIVDGGIGQLGILTAVMTELGINGIDLAGLAKSRVERSMTASDLSRSEERVFLPGRKNPVSLRQNSPALLLLARIRDEAHRFAITYHRKLRGNAAISSELDAISGIGTALRKRLLEKFGSVQGIRNASPEELAAVKGITPALAARIKAEMT
ncbi:MAG: excinuclease ABC subunit UvrC, partial [Geobacter sp.]|nr:excinuclease ABC subunit UvrC [Geobacter sp.]